jgi:hypothetical protein
MVVFLLVSAFFDDTSIFKFALQIFYGKEFLRIILLLYLVILMNFRTFKLLYIIEIRTRIYFIFIH